MSNKATHRTDRRTIGRLTSIVNIGESIAEDLSRIGIQTPKKLIGRDPWDLYRKICEREGAVIDPCLLDCMMAVTDFMNGGPPKKWWSYTKRRKRIYADRLRALSAGIFGTSAPSRKKKRRRAAASA